MKTTKSRNEKLAAWAVVVVLMCLFWAAVFAITYTHLADGHDRGRGRGRGRGRDPVGLPILSIRSREPEQQNRKIELIERLRELEGEPDPLHSPEPARRFCLTNDDCHTIVGGELDDEGTPVTWWTLGTCNSAEQRCNDE